MKSKLFYVIFSIICIVGVIAIFIFGNNMNDIQLRLVSIISALSFAGVLIATLINYVINDI